MVDLYLGVLGDVINGFVVEELDIRVGFRSSSVEGVACSVWLLCGK